KKGLSSLWAFSLDITKIYDRETGEVTYGRVPAGSVVFRVAFHLNVANIVYIAL
ncbi:hypothetical protein KCU_03476, partial [Pasteurella multocida subsp. multocida str. P52VAC]